MRQINGRKEFFLSAIGIVAVAVLIASTLVNPARSSAEPQTQNTPANSPAFQYDVVSIKPTKSATRYGRFENTPDGFTVQSTTVLELIQRAYGVPIGSDDGRIANAPSWLTAEHFDIDARMDGAVTEASQKLRPNDLRSARLQMLQVLLADYFKLTISRETRQLQRYSLSVAEGGPKLQDATPDEVAANTARVLAGRGPGELMKPVLGGMAFKSFRIETFTQYLSQMLQRPVMDETGLTGQYDFEFIFFTPNVGPAPVPAAPGAANAQSAIPQTNDTDYSGVIEGAKKLGLKLDSGKGPVEVIVVTHVERPSGN
jgi:uncharacterized protein (TIGR03435 family)